MVTADIPAAFMQVDQEETVNMQLEVVLAELVIKCDLKLYHPYVTQENEKFVLYVELIKDLYGMQQAAFIFWCKLTAKLVKW